MKARVIRPQELAAADLEHWRSITEKSDLYRSAFYAPEFTIAIAEARRDAFVAVLEQAGETVGYFPFHKLRAGVAKPIGGPISDYHGPVLAPGFTPEPTDLLAACQLTAYDFNHLPVAFKALAASSYGHAQSPRIHLPDGYEAYAQERARALKKTMSTMARRRRKLEREVGPIRFSFHDASDDVYEKLQSMKAQQFAEIGVQSVFDNPWTARAIDTIRNTQSPSFAGVVSTLHAGDALMAVHLGMRSANELHWWFPTYDRTASKYSSGILLLLEIARHAHEHGVSSIDLGRGDEGYKSKFANDATELCEGSIERVGAAAGLLRKGQKAVLRLSQPLPLGQYENYPRRALARLISGMQLPASKD